MGELLIDFFCKETDSDLVDGKNFEKQAGGAPANVCATISKLGGHASFIGKVGNDPFGYFLKNTLLQLKVDTSMLIYDHVHPTTMAFVSLTSDGERDFVFNRGADAYLEENEIDGNLVANASILHFGSATALLSEPFLSTYMNSMRKGKEQHQFISFDPNFRKDLWKEDMNSFIKRVRECLPYVDFLKVSEEELFILTDTATHEDAVNNLHSLGAKIIAVTLGEKGTYLSNGTHAKVVSSTPIQAIDSTGAGDAFVGAMLYQIAQRNEYTRLIKDFKWLEEMTLFSNKVGALVCTKVGAITAIPTLEEVMEM
ncbi:carbohydrate kinase family protein [Alkalicoccobacillus gibsonii]|uniref:carbohydrate kinase family protein n=1 Tax=Alkalicoccobacillus gibsonii TaxID=79881 RepID=UPI003F7B5E6A